VPITMEKARRSLAKLKMGISGASGSGKTLSSLLLGYGLVKSANPNYSDAEVWGKICIIDTENKSGSLYTGATVSGQKIGTYNAINLSPPFHPKEYLEAIQVAEDAGIEFLIIDSLTHAWAGEGGMLDIHGNASARIGNSYTAWREVTPLHNRLIDKIMQCDMHVAIALRSKTEYVLEANGKGKQIPVKKGMAPIFRDDVEYEVTIFFEIEQNHQAVVSKDRTGMFEPSEYFFITPKTGAKVYGWLVSGADNLPPKIEKAAQQNAVAPEDIEAQQENADDVPDSSVITNTMVDAVIKAYTKGMPIEEKRAIGAEIKQISGTVNYMNVTDPEILTKLYERFRKE